MKLGTKTLLFGGHQFLIHPILVTVAWVKLYRSFPNWKELLCIFIHDWGYWGMIDLKDASGDMHPRYAAKLAGKWLGKEWEDFILGHSSFYIAREGIEKSKLLAPDKYWHCLIPLWFYKLLTVPSGEFKHYRELDHARQVADRTASDEVWWENIQDLCVKKIKGNYIIDNNKLHRKGDVE